MQQGEKFEKFKEEAFERMDHEEAAICEELEKHAESEDWTVWLNTGAGQTGVDMVLRKANRTFVSGSEVDASACPWYCPKQLTGKRSQFQSVLWGRGHDYQKGGT